MEHITTIFNDHFLTLYIVLTILGGLQMLHWIKKSSRFINGLIFTFILFLLQAFTFPIVFPIIGVTSVILLLLKFRRIGFLRKRRKRKIPTKKRRTDSIYLESNQGTIEIGNIYRGTMVQGGAGSGKSKSLFYPIIQQTIQNDFAGILYDFKSPELSELAYSYHTDNQKTKFAFLNFKDFKTSIRVNPLAPRYLTKQAIAFEVATVLINNLLPESIKKKDYWTRSSISIVAGAIWYLRKNYPEYCTIPHLIAFILDFTSPSLIEIISSDVETAGMISSLKEAYEMKSEKQIAGVIGTVKNAMAQLNIPEVFYLISKDDFDLQINNPNNPTFLAIGNDSTLADTFAPIISLIISVCLRQMNQPNRHKSAIILDEAPTLYIPNFEQIPATARSNKIATYYGLQDYSQMVDKYGTDKAQVMISNLGNQFYGRTVNEKSAKMIINLFGKHDQRYRTVSQSSGSSSGGFFSSNSSSSSNNSESVSVQQRDRIKISEITGMAAGTFYGVIAEGVQTELLSTQLKETKTTIRKIENINHGNPNDNFRLIHTEVKNITSLYETETNENDYKIKL